MCKSEFKFGCGSYQCGLTLIELIVTVMVLGILSAIAIPSFTNFFERQRLIGAASALSEAIGYTRAEALKRDTEMTLSVDASPSSQWCFGSIVSSSGCSCDGGSPACEVDGALQGSSYSDFPGVTLSASQSLYSINPRRGTISSTEYMTLTNSLGNELRVEMTKLGRASICVPAGSEVLGYTGC